ncbi:ABC transporter ATP-binding protein [Cesiribacter sp. SM1]|uniref:ABC transporter ATP-binding protein n=1 Tax=Cesiribacter sp. SM1 TaxID=2861196 RepID=UPI001CD551B2|nr:ABC transporter ATP-binding protein [Cesiribacter sp. SM1]
MSDIAIKVEQLSKRYRLGVVGTGTLSHDLNRWWYQLRGKEDPNLSIDDSHKHIAGNQYVWALQDVDLEIRKGEVLGIIGRNGAGKSTFLKLLSRVTSPTSGIIKIHGRISSLLEVGTGFQPELTGRENIFLNGAILGMSRAEIRKKFDEIVAFSGISQFIDTPVKRYSSGMWVRLAFAVAAHLEADILIVDEVLAVGDAEFQKKAIGKMQNIVCNSPKTVLFVSHDMSAVRALCTSSVLLNGGRIEMQSSVDAVIARYLTAGISEGRQVSWNENNAPLGDGIRLHSLRIEDSQGTVSGSLSNTSNLIIRISYTLHQPIPNLRLVLSVISARGVEVLTSTSHAAGSADYHTTGKFEASCCIPGKLLNIGHYLLRLRVDVPTEQVIVPSFEALQFRISELDFHQYGRIVPGEPSGLIHIDAPWVVQKKQES